MTIRALSANLNTQRVIQARILGVSTVPPSLPVQAEVTVPEALSAGAYANAFGTWFSQTDFTIDFLVQQPGEPRTDADGNPHLFQPLQVVSRVKFSPALIFRLIQNLNQAMTNYESQFGAIAPLGEPIPPPADENPPGP